MFYAQEDLSAYTPEFLAYCRKIPARKFGSFAEWVNKVILPMGDWTADRIYRPVKIPVRMSMNSVNSTGVLVSPWRDDYFKIVQKSVAAMMGIADWRKVDVRDLSGKSIGSMNIQELGRVIDSRVYVGEDIVMVANPPSPPAAISPVKGHLLLQAINDMQMAVAEIVGKTLKGATSYSDLSSRMQSTFQVDGKEGALEKAIREYLGTVVTDEFVSGYTETEYAAGLKTSDVIDDLTCVIMGHVSTSLSNSRDEVDRCMAQHNGVGSLFKPSAAPAARDVAASAINSAAPRVDEYSTYQRIGRHGMYYHTVRPQLRRIISRGHPARRFAYYAGKGGRNRVTATTTTRKVFHHTGPHHHPYGHPHKSRRRAVYSAPSKPLNLHPYRHPVYNSPWWWFGSYPHYYYTKGHGARVREKYTSAEYHDNGGEARLAADAMDSEYRGDVAQVRAAYRKFSGCAPCPTKSLMDSLSQVSASSPIESSLDAPVLVEGKPFAYTLRLKYLKAQLKRALAAGKTRRVAKYERLIEKLEAQNASVDAVVHVSELIGIAVEDAIEDGGPAIPDTYALLANYFTPIACDMCDKAMYKRKLEIEEKRRRAAVSSSDDDRERDLKARIESLREKYIALTGRDYDFSMALAQGLRVIEDKMDATARARAVADAITKRIQVFADLCEPVLNQDGSGFIDQRAQTVNTAVSVMCKLAQKQGVGMAEQVIDDMVNVDTEGDLEGQDVWRSVRSQCEPYFYGQEQPVALGIEEAIAIDGRYAGTKRAARALKKAFNTEDEANAAAALTEDDALLAYLDAKLQQGSLSAMEEVAVLKIVRRLKKALGRRARGRYRKAYYASRRRQKAAGRSEKARDAYFSSSRDPLAEDDDSTPIFSGSPCPTNKVVGDAVLAAIGDEDDDVSPIGVIVDSVYARRQFRRVLNPEDYAALEALDTDAAAVAFLTELDYNGRAADVIAKYITAYNRRMQKAEKRRRRLYRQVARDDRVSDRRTGRNEAWREKLRQAGNTSISRDVEMAMDQEVEEKESVNTVDGHLDDIVLQRKAEMAFDEFEDLGDKDRDVYGSDDTAYDRSGGTYPASKDRDMNMYLRKAKQMRELGEFEEAERYMRMYEEQRSDAVRMRNYSQSDPYLANEVPEMVLDVTDAVPNAQPVAVSTTAPTEQSFSILSYEEMRAAMNKDL